MKTLIALIVLVVLALVGSRRTFVTRRLPFGGRMVFTGSEFIIIGLLLGSGYLNLIDERALGRLQPFVCVTLGCLGMVLVYQILLQVNKITGDTSGNYHPHIKSLFDDFSGCLN